MNMSTRTKFLFSLLILIILLGTLLVSGTAGYHQGALSDNILRLHILGNTNSDADQKLKLMVRDRILMEYRDVFAHATNQKDAILRTEKALPKMQKTAENVLRQQGCSQPVSVQMKETSFPTKQYGSVTLPAGKYTAVNICIGKAAGNNWWCVLYPPLCLTEGTVHAEEETLAILKRELSPSDYALLTQSDNISFRMKFKILELLGKIFS